MISLFAKSILMIGLSISVIILQSVELISDVIPSGLMKITWGILMTFMIWFVVSVYKDYKAFKKETYPKFNDFDIRLTKIETKIDLLINKDNEVSSKKLSKK